jgi:hypothetical protein
MTIPHRNNVPKTVPGRPDHHHHAPIQIPRRDEAILAILVPGVRTRRYLTHEHLPGVSEIQSSLGSGLGPLCRVEAGVHRYFLYPHLIRASTIYVDANKIGLHPPPDVA